LITLPGGGSLSIHLGQLLLVVATLIRTADMKSLVATLEPMLDET
jgi:hypothetical protein